MSNPHHVVSLYRQRLDSITKLLSRAARSALAAADSKLLSSKERIGSLNPLNVLGRGYSIVLDKNGVPIKNALELYAGQQVDIRISGGAASAVVEEVRKD